MRPAHLQVGQCGDANRGGLGLLRPGVEANGLLGELSQGALARPGQGVEGGSRGWEAGLTALPKDQR